MDCGLGLDCGSLLVDDDLELGVGLAPDLALTAARDLAVEVLPLDVDVVGEVTLEKQGCQMAKFDPFLSLDCARVEGVGAQSKGRKGSNFAAQRSGAIVQKPEGPNTYDLKIWL